VAHLPELLQQQSHGKNSVIISKNDRIFICSDPKPTEVNP